MNTKYKIVDDKMALSIEQELFHPLNGWVFHSDLRLKSAESESLLKSCAVPSAEVNVQVERGNLDRLRTLGGSGVNKPCYTVGQLNLLILEISHGMR